MFEKCMGCELERGLSIMGTQQAAILEQPLPAVAPD